MYPRALRPVKLIVGAQPGAHLIEGAEACTHLISMAFVMARSLLNMHPGVGISTMVSR